jgi:hypothetical protein
MRVWVLALPSERATSPRRPNCALRFKHRLETWNGSAARHDEGAVRGAGAPSGGVWRGKPRPLVTVSPRAVVRPPGAFCSVPVGGGARPPGARRRDAVAIVGRGDTDSSCVPARWVGVVLASRSSQLLKFLPLDPITSESTEANRPDDLANRLRPISDHRDQAVIDGEAASEGAPPTDEPSESSPGGRCRHTNTTAKFK